jgi:spermidine synthase
MTIHTAKIQKLARHDAQEFLSEASTEDIMIEQRDGQEGPSEALVNALTGAGCAKYLAPPGQYSQPPDLRGKSVRRKLPALSRAAQACPQCYSKEGTP